MCVDAAPREAEEAWRAALHAVRPYLRSMSWAREDIVSDALLGAAIALNRHDPARGPIGPFAALCAEQHVQRGMRDRGGMARGGTSEPERRKGVTMADLPAWRQHPAHIEGFDDVHEMLLDAQEHGRDPAGDVVHRVDLDRSMIDLTGRERRAIEMTMLGFTQPEVGDHLGASRDGIKQSLKRSYAKMRPLLAVKA